MNGVGGEIASVWVRIRPNFAGFKETATAEIRGVLHKMQGEVASSARANVSATNSEIASNKELAGSYKTVMAASETAIATTKESIQLNRMLATSYAQLAAAAKAGSVEQMTYTKLGQEAQLRAAATVQETARANVAATATEITANRELAASYALIARSAKAGSAEQLAAAKLSAQAGGASAAGAAAGAAGRARGAGAGLGARALGPAVAGAIGIHFIKDLVQEAAGVQKFKETVTSQFGAASKAIFEFASNGAAKLGIIDDTIYETSARFGVLFKNLGVGQGVASQMTVGWEKLGGALAAIRGLDPAKAMAALPLAAAGNARGLKQLGIVIDQTEVKNEALRLGLIATTKGAITPGIKAQAIYSIATKNLGSYLEEAKKHSADYANVQRRLAVAWDNATDVLGEGLLPYVARFAEFLSRNMPAAVKYTTIAFSDLKTTISQFVDFIRPGIEAIRKSSTATKIALAGLTIAVGALVAAAFPITSVVLAIAGLGIAFQEAYKRSERFRQIVHSIGEFIKRDLVPAFQTAVAVIQGIWQRWGETITRVVKIYLGTAVALIKHQIEIIKGVFNVLAGIVTLDWRRAWGGLKGIVGNALGAVVDVIKGYGNIIKAVFTGIWDNVKETVIRLELWIVDKFSKIPTKIKTPLGDIGFTNPFEGMKKGLEDDLANLRNGDIVANAQKTLVDFAKNAVLLATGHGSGQKIGDSIVGGINDALSIGTATLSTAEIAALNAANQKIANAKARLVAAEKAGQESRRAAQASLENYITQSNERIAALTQSGNEKIVKSARDAAANLVSIGKKLSDGIGKFLDKGADTSGPSKAIEAQFKALKEALASGHGGPDVLQKAQLLTSQLRDQQGDKPDNAATTAKKKLVQQRVNDLTDELNRHLITWKSFQSKLHTFLGGQGITYKKIYGSLGRSAADAFQEQIKGLGLQAKAIAGESPHVRNLIHKAGGGGTATSLKIIDPNVIATKVQAQITAANTRRQLGITQHEGALARAETRAASRTQAARDAVTHANQAKALAVAEHQLASTKQVATNTKETAKATKAKPPRSGAGKSTSSGPTGLQGPVGVNPGFQSAGARYGAAAGLGTGG